MDTKKSIITSTSVTMPSRKGVQPKEDHENKVDYSNEVNISYEYIKRRRNREATTPIELHGWLNELAQDEYDTGPAKLFRVLIVDMNGTPVPNALVAVWEACLEPSPECFLVNERTDNNGYVQFQHSYPDHVNLKIRCRHPAMPNMNGMDTVVSSNQTPVAITLDFEVNARHLPGYRSPFV